MVKIKEVEGLTEAEFEIFAEKKDACYHKAVSYTHLRAHET